MHSSIDSGNLDKPVHAAEERGLEVGEAERGDDDGALVGETVGDVVHGGEEGEEPGFGVVDGFPESVGAPMSREREKGERGEERRTARS